MKTQLTKHGEMSSSMTETEYRTHPSVSRSDLWNMRLSPEKYKYMHDNPSLPTDALLFGQVFHKLVLEPDDFSNEFAVMPQIDRRTKAGKQQAEEFAKDAVGKSIVTQEMYQQALGMKMSVGNVDQACKLLDGKHEVPYFWLDEESGIECKCRADCVSKIGDINIIVDLKSCQDASTDKFTREALRYGYDFQSAFYSDGISKCTGDDYLFVFIAVEKNPPYAVNILQASPEFTNHGRNTMRDLLEKYKYCFDSNNWYGYMGKENNINTLELPAWME